MTITTLRTKEMMSLLMLFDSVTPPAILGPLLRIVTEFVWWGSSSVGGSMKRIVTLLILAMTLVLLVCLMAAAQGATAQIIGTVKDQSGAVLPGAEVTATQTDTGATRMTVSDETGSYSLPNLPVGPYKLEVSLPGFRTFVQSGI